MVKGTLHVPKQMSLDLCRALLSIFPVLLVLPALGMAMGMGLEASSLSGYVRIARMTCKRKSCCQTVCVHTATVWLS